MKGITLRIAAVHDAPELLEIYAPYVANTAISFEYDVPALEEFAQRVENTLKRYPYIVAISDSEIVGYAYAGTFKPRAAYDWSVETTVYVKQGFKGRGVGRLLYDALEKCICEQGITNLNACIAFSDIEDDYLTQDSVRFHSALGYREVGKFRSCAYKNGRWFDMIWMEKHILEHSEQPGQIVPFSEIRPLLWEKYALR